MLSFSPRRYMFSSCLDIPIPVASYLGFDKRFKQIGKGSTRKMFQILYETVSYVRQHMMPLL